MKPGKRGRWEERPHVSDSHINQTIHSPLLQAHIQVAVTNTNLRRSKSVKGHRNLLGVEQVNCFQVARVCFSLHISLTGVSVYWTGS